jgi:hypothetical protein
MQDGQQERCFHYLVNVKVNEAVKLGDPMVKRALKQYLHEATSWREGARLMRSSVVQTLWRTLLSDFERKHVTLSPNLRHLSG